MKKIAFAVLAVILIASMGYAATLLVGTRKHPANANKYRTTWSHPSSTPTGLINATGATTHYGVSSGCDIGKVKFGDVTGSNIMNVALQVADLYGPQYGASPVSDGLFTNAIGTDTEPYHQVDPNDSDTLKFDFNSREFTLWRLNCLAGCGVNNTIETAWGDCWMSGQGGR